MNGFLARHPIITKNLLIAHAMGANPTVIIQWFDLLKKIQTKVGIVSPAQIWSGDETGIENIPKEIKVLGIKNIRTFQQVSSEQGGTSTILSFVNALRNVVPSMIIHIGQQVQDSWKIKLPHNFCIAATTKCYITKSEFHEYVLKIIKYLTLHAPALHSYVNCPDRI